jgi:hypothetical protein
MPCNLCRRQFLSIAQKLTGCNFCWRGNERAKVVATPLRGVFGTARSWYSATRLRADYSGIRVWGAALGVPLAVGQVWVWAEAELRLPLLSL